MREQLLGQFVEISPEARVGRPDSEGGVGSVSSVHEDGTFDISWVLGGSEKNVLRQRIASMDPLVLTARRTSATDVTRPSILAPSHQPVAAQTSPTGAAQGPGTERVCDVILESRSWSNFEVVANPLLRFLCRGKNKPRGWLRLDENEYTKC